MLHNFGLSAAVEKLVSQNFILFVEKKTTFIKVYSMFIDRNENLGKCRAKFGPLFTTSCS